MGFSTSGQDFISPGRNFYGNLSPMRQISPEAVGLEIDTSDAPHTWNVYTVNKDGDLVDLFDELYDSKKAHAFARDLRADAPGETPAHPAAVH
jgi:hypothetical protein